MAGKSKSKGGAGKFFLGAALGAAVGAVAGRFISAGAKKSACGCGEECDCDDEMNCGCHGKDVEAKVEEKPAAAKKSVEKKTEAEKKKD